MCPLQLLPFWVVMDYDLVAAYVGSLNNLKNLEVLAAPPMEKEAGLFCGRARCWPILGVLTT
jgi:hypothetical protein